MIVEAVEEWQFILGAAIVIAGFVTGWLLHRWWTRGKW